jgi:hypothetical protein
LPPPIAYLACGGQMVPPHVLTGFLPANGYCVPDQINIVQHTADSHIIA